MRVLLDKFREVVTAVFPVVALVILFNFTLTPIDGIFLFQFIIGALAIIFGMTILLLGVEIGIMPFGKHMGASFLKSNKMWYVIAVGFILGFLINFAEPDLQVLAAEVELITGGSLPMLLILAVVSIGTGVMLTLGIIRIVKQFRLNILFVVTYIMVGILALFCITKSPEMLAIGFDASGATTGVLTVPLVLALCIGVASMKKDSKTAEEDSFGLVGAMSAGAPLAVLILNLWSKEVTPPDVLPTRSVAAGYFGPFIETLPQIAIQGMNALFPVILVLFIFQKWKFRLPAKAFNKMFLGFIYTYIGLVVFLTGVNGGFMNVGNLVGRGLALHDNMVILVGFGFLLGMLVILCEPAVYVLTHQIEDVTSGYIKRRTVLITLSIGVAFAVGLAMLRIAVPGIQLWHYLLPGIAISLAMTFFVPKIFVGIAFDSGGVASGPMTATFVLAMAQGASDAVEHSNLLVDSFGVIAMVAITPLIALQVLGLIYRFQTRKKEAGE